MPDLLLASASPRRKALLAEAGYTFCVFSPDVEEIHDLTLGCEEQTITNALLKARAAHAQRPECLVIGADTLVYLDDKPLGKPASLDEARQMLRLLSGRTHRVCTGVAIVSSASETTFATITEVTFKTLNSEIIEEYLAKVHVMDKAGSYAVQERGDLIIADVNGSRSNVVGLPVEDLNQKLHSLGITPERQPQPTTRKTLVYDIGNVLVTFDFSRASSSIVNQSNCTPQEFLDRIDDIKQALEGGEIDEDTFFAQAIQLCAFTGTREEFETAWCDIFEVNEPMLQTLEHLRTLPDSPRLLLLSNTNEPHRRWLFEKYPQIFRHFEGGIYSHSARSMKPGDEIFRQLVADYTVDTSRAFYIDDLPANIAAGRSWGLHSRQYHPKEHAAFQQALNRWLAETP
ncbi:MAG: septum formation protein Maf [Verrucomicrobiaceae bacterium]|nr:septum formation protein Maf [Verrucomicrobiaceae bacterium]